MLSRVCAVLGIGLVAATALALDAANLVLYVSFDEGKGDTAADTSPTKATGKISGAVKWTKDGKFGGAVEFGADGTVEFPDLPALDLDKEITMAGWIYPTDAPADTSLWGRRTPPNQGGYCMQWTAGMVETWIGLPGWVGTRGQQATKPKVNEWHFVVGIYDGASVVQYVDGKEDSNVKGGNPINRVAEVFYIGRARTGLTPMPGRIDEVVVFNRALKLAETEELRTRGMAALLAVAPRGKLPLRWGEVKSRR
jgi:hypothetical protein